MKIVTFNINGVRQRLTNLLAWLEKTRPDVVCLQEIKVHDADFPRAELERAGYGAIWRGQGAHHGVAILAREVEPLETRRALPGDPADVEARYIEAAVEGVLVGRVYLPNGNPWPGPSERCIRPDQDASARPRGAISGIEHRSRNTTSSANRRTSMPGHRPGSGEDAAASL